MAGRTMDWPESTLPTIAAFSGVTGTEARSAIIEFAGGEPVVHHGREFTVMTNDPTQDEQLTLLAQQGFSDPSRDMPLPGNGNAVDRFQHAACYAALLPEPADVRQALAVDELKLDDDSDRWISIRTTPH